MLRVEGASPEGYIVARERFGRTELVDPSTGKTILLQSLEGLKTWETEKPLTRFPNFRDRPRDFLTKQREERSRAIEEIIKDGRKQKKLDKGSREKGPKEPKEPRKPTQKKINNTLAQQEARLALEEKLSKLPPLVAMALRKQMGLK